jgi:hypothetical protein
MPSFFDRKLFLWLFAGFLLFTVAGTLLHESGHYLAGKLQGRDSMRIAYAYTTYGVHAADDSLAALYRLHYEDIVHNRHFAGEDAYHRLDALVARNSFLFTLGGPLQTMLTGTIALVVMVACGKRFRGAQKLRFGQWLLVFLSMFWLREIVNLVMMLARVALGHTNKMRGDEFRLALYLHWHPWSVQVACGIVSVSVAAVVIFRYVPLRQRAEFIAAALAGGVCGYVLWLELLGPVLMP